VIHGAGVIEDGWLLDKARAGIDRVIDTKVDSAFLLAKHLRPDTLKFLAFFTSVAGRFGNRGQADYATANEILGRLAWVLAARWGDRIKVAAINWSPWDRTTHGAGMVTPEVRRQFEARGVRLVGSAAGRRFLLNELLYGPTADVELVAGDFPWEREEARLGALPGQADPSVIVAGPLALLCGGRLAQSGPSAWRFAKTLDLVGDLYLDQHRLDGVPVLPFAIGLEYMAEAAVAAGLEESDALELADVRLFQGLRLAREDLPIEIEVRAEPVAAPERRRFDVTLAAADGAGKIAYRASVRAGEAAVGETLPPPLVADAAMAAVAVDEAYRRWLFHGPLFQSIARIDALDRRGFDLVLAPSRAADFCPFAERGEWLIDPAVVDALFQGVLIWSRRVRDSATLPNRIGLIRRFGRDALPGELTARVRIHSDPSHPVTTGDAVFGDARGRVLLAVRQFECTASAALNRLGGGWAGGVRGPQWS